MSFPVPKTVKKREKDKTNGEEGVLDGVRLDDIVARGVDSVHDDSSIGSHGSVDSDLSHELSLHDANLEEREDLLTVFEELFWLCFAR